MLGLMVLFGLGVWLVVTLMSMFAGYKLFKGVSKNTVLGVLGAFLGFMLTMGGLIIYWAVEYYQIQQQVTQLCESEGGITVYVTPEQWRKQIGEAEWNLLIPYTNNRQSIYERQIFVFENKEYQISAKFNKRFAVYRAYEKPLEYVLGNYALYLDTVDKKPLFKMNSFNAGVGSIANNLSGLKLWIDNINDCYPYGTKNERRSLIAQYSNQLKGTQHE